MWYKICAFLLIFICVGAEAAKPIIVSVKQGKMAGVRESTVFDKRLYFSFYGIPYAVPPVGNLRFKDPQPLTNWTGIWDGTQPFHGACAQTHIVYKDKLFGNEDCLYLNIFTPSIPKDKDVPLMPVLVWIHGYGFTSSFSHIQKPDFVINKGIILVTLTHRIGVFGFLKGKRNDSDTNMGLKDIVLALKWIRSNIKELGGDKKKLTLMGNNSGATFISLLMTTEARNLFSKVILQSGALFSPSIFQSNPNLDRKKILRELKAQKLKLRTATDQEIINAAHKISIRNRKELENQQRPFVPFTPVISNHSNSSFIIKKPSQFYRTVDKTSSYFNKPILIGYNSEESISEMIPFIQNPRFIKKYLKDFKFMVPFMDGCKYNSSSKMYKTLSSIIRERYFKEGDGEPSLTSLLKYGSDLLVYPILKFIKTHLEMGAAKMFMYKFDYRGQVNAVKANSLAHQNINLKGAASGDEICYILACEPYAQFYGTMDKEETNRDKTFIKNISQLWANFVLYGDPTPSNHDTNLTWLPVDSNLNNMLLIRNTFKLKSTQKEKNILDFWNNLYETYFKKDVCQRNHDEL